MSQAPTPRTVFVATIVAVLLVIGALTTALDVPSQGLVVLAVWTLAMIPPLLVIPGLAAHLASRMQSNEAAEQALAELEATHGPLVGRHGTARRYKPKDGYPLPPGTERWTYVDDEDEALELPILPHPAPPASGTSVQITAVRPVRPKEVPYAHGGIGVQVSATTG